VRALYDLTLAAAVLIGAVGGSQVPRFVQEYEQRLGGAFQEASRQLAEYRRVADESRLPFPDYIQRLTTSPDASVAATGRAVAAVGARSADLDAQVQSLQRAPRIIKPFILLRDHDPDLLRATWERFETTLTLEPSFAAVGAIFGWAVNALFWHVPVRRRKAAAV
jgi:Protein of unknown function (DUF2937)